MEVESIWRTMTCLSVGVKQKHEGRFEGPSRSDRALTLRSVFCNKVEKGTVSKWPAFSVIKAAYSL